MKAKINIEVTDIATEQWQFNTELQGPPEHIIEGLLEALAQVETGNNEAETAILRLYVDYRLKCIRKEHDNEN